MDPASSSNTEPVAGTSRNAARAQMSFAERKANMTKASPPHLVEGSQITRSIDRGPPGDPAASSRARRARSKPELGRQRSLYFENAFSTRDGGGGGGGDTAAQDRVRREAKVVAEVRTNVIVNDEFTMITELMYHLCMRYKRPITSVVVTLQHGACMCFGGTFEPAYILSVSALPAELQPATNRRNTVLLQKHMEEALGVVPARGLVRFIPTPEDCVACDGKTVAGELDELARGVLPETAEEAPEENVVSTPKSRKRMSVKVSPPHHQELPSSERTAHINYIPNKSLGSFKAPKSPLSNELTPPSTGDVSSSTTRPGSATTEPAATEQHEAMPEKQPRRRKSFMSNLFARSTHKAQKQQPPLPPSREE